MRTASGLALLALLTACSSETERPTPRLDAIERTFGFSLSQNAGVARKIEMLTPGHADEETSLRAGAMELRFAPEKASHVLREDVRGVGVFRDAFGAGTDIVRAELGSGVEDFITFDARPEKEQLSYRAALRGVAGLRLVQDVLEFLDDKGAPRLRVAAPWVLDARGGVSRAHLAVAYCDLDTNLQAPWGRPVVPPGSSACRIIVGWHVDAYPALVDPSWSDAGNMNVEREGHDAVLLPSGRVLVGGGGSLGAPNRPQNTPTPFVEIYDPATSTFAVTGSLNVARFNQTATALPDGRVIFIGGSDNAAAVVSTTELYNEATGVFTAGPPLCQRA